MAEGSDDHDKKHAPTERRLRQAAERGDVARSTDLPKAAAIVLVTTIGLNAAADFGSRLENICATALTLSGTGDISLASVSSQAFIIETAPLLVLIGALSALVGVLFGGWTFSVTALMPDFSKLSPSHGLGQLFSVSGFTDTLKSMAKFLIIGGVGETTIRNNWYAFAALGMPVQSSIGAMTALCLHILANICAAIIGIAGVDMGVQFWLHRRRHRMSDQEMRDEIKEVVGNPQVRQRQRAIARRMARSRQMRRVPEASVIITNPTHFAVAIRFRRGVDPAPILLAKGAGLLAAEIITQARSHGIPIVEAPPVARAIYRYVEPDDPIPVALYRACAEILAYVWRLQQWRASRETRQKPHLPKISSFEIGHRTSD
ncbi:EscU/YscU/HrcU family type III secretion system export apparatus switch protein [Acidisoma sp.]|uniref:EscU/YscU/HrcU family type III secretion system export apparatus switch protein n=1 Tax=Acidisoma sp. TaxID=1872115 RepID=UPI003B00F3C7